MSILRLAIGDALADRKRTVLSIAALAPIVACYLIQTAVASGLRHEDIAPDAENILLVAADALDPASGRLDPSVLDVPGDVGEDDVALWGPVVFRAMRVDDVVVQMRAAPLDEWGPLHRLVLAEGRMPGPDTDEIAVTRGISIATGWEIGDRVAIYGTVFEVTAVLDAPGTKFASVWMDFDRADRLFEGLAGFQMVTVRTSSGADPADLIERLEAVADDRYVVYYESALAAEHSARSSAAVEISLMALLIGGAALALGSFNLAALLLAERAREVGIVRTLGMSRAAIRGLVVARSLAIAAPAFLIGGAIAFLVAATSSTTTLRAVVFDVAIPPSGWAQAAVLTFGVTIVGSLAAFSFAGRARIRDLVGSA